MCVSCVVSLHVVSLSHVVSVPCLMFLVNMICLVYLFRSVVVLVCVVLVLTCVSFSSCLLHLSPFTFIRWRRICCFRSRALV